MTLLSTFVPRYIIGWWHQRDTDGIQALVEYLLWVWALQLTVQPLLMILGGRIQAEAAAQDPNMGLVQDNTDLFIDCCLFETPQEAIAIANGGLVWDSNVYFDYPVYAKWDAKCDMEDLSHQLQGSCVGNTVWPVTYQPRHLFAFPNVADWLLTCVKLHMFFYNMVLKFNGFTWEQWQQLTTVSLWPVNCQQDTVCQVNPERDKRQQRSEQRRAMTALSLALQASSLFTLKVDQVVTPANVAELK